MKVETTQWQRGLAAARADMAKSQTQADGLNKSLEATERAGTSSGAAIAAAFAPLVVLLGSVVKEAMSLQQAMKDVQSVTGATTKQMEDLAGQASRIVSLLGGSQAEIIRGAGELVKAGASLKDVLQDGELAVAALNKATGEGVQLSAELLASINNSFKGQRTFIGFADLIANVANVSALNLNGLQVAMGNVGATAAQAGVPIEDVAAGLASLSNAGQQASDSGTGLRTFFTRLIPNVQENIELFRKFGLINEQNQNILFDSTGRVKDLATVIDILNAKFKGLDGEQMTGLLNKLFGDEAQKVVSTLLKQGGDALRDLKAQLSDVKAVDVASQRIETAAGAIDRMKSEASMAAAELGSEFLPAIQTLADGIALLTKNFAALSDDTKSTLAAMGTGAATFLGITLLIRGLQAGALLMTSTYGGLTVATAAQTAANAKLATSIGAVNAAQGAGLATGAAATSRLATITRFLGPIGILLSVAASGYAAYKVHASAAAESEMKFAEGLAAIHAELAKSPLKNTVDDVQHMRSQIEQLQPLVAEYERIVKRQAELQKTRDEYRRNGSERGFQSYKALNDEEEKLSGAYAKVTAALKEMNVPAKQARAILDGLNQQVERSVTALHEMNRAEIEDMATRQTKIKQLEDAAATIAKYGGASTLTAEQIADLRGATETLQQQIPRLVVEVDAQGRAHVRNSEVIGEQIQMEKALVSTQADALVATMQHNRQRAASDLAAEKALYGSLQRRAAAYQKYVATLSQADEMVATNTGSRALRSSEEQGAGAMAAINGLTALIAQIDDDMARVTRGDFMPAPVKPTYDYDPYADTSKSRAKKDTSAEDLAREAEQARRESYERDLAYSKRLLETGAVNESQYVERLKSIRSSYSDWLAKNYQEQYAIENEIATTSANAAFERIEVRKRSWEAEGRTAKEIAAMEVDSLKWIASQDEFLAADRKKANDQLHGALLDLQTETFAESEKWTSAREKSMERAGSSEIEIATMVYQAWSRVNSRRGSGMYSADDEARASEAMLDAKDRLESALAASLRQARDLDASEAIRAAEQAAKDAEKAMEERHRAEEKAIQDRLDALDREREAEEYLLDITERRKELADLEAQRAQVAALKDREFITRDENGNLISTMIADTERLRELDEQIARQRRDVEQRERDESDRRQRQQLEDELQRLRESQQREVEELRASNEAKMAALQAYWERMKSEEQVLADTRFLIEKNGTEATVTMINGYLDSVVSAYKARQDEIMRLGGLIPNQSGAVVGGYDPLPASGTKGNAEDLAREQMRRNSEQWSRTKDPSERERLHQDNVRIGTGIGGVYDPSTGKWSFPKHHTGTEYVTGPHKGAEVPRLLEVGEAVVTRAQRDREISFMAEAIEALQSWSPMGDFNRAMSQVLAPRPMELPRSALGGGGANVQVDIDLDVHSADIRAIARQVGEETERRVIERLTGVIRNR